MLTEFDSIRLSKKVLQFIHLPITIPLPNPPICPPPKSFVGWIRLNFYSSLLLIFHSRHTSIEATVYSFPGRTRLDFLLNIHHSSHLVRIYVVSIICVLGYSNLTENLCPFVAPGIISWRERARLVFVGSLACYMDPQIRLVVYIDGQSNWLNLV